MTHHALSAVLTLHTYFHSTGSTSHVNPVYWLALLALSGFFFYRAQMRRYRNRDKSYQYEHKSRAHVWGVQHSDKFVTHIHGTRSDTVENYSRSSDPRDRVAPLP